MQPELFPPGPPTLSQSQPPHRRSLEQFFTPEWAAVRLVEHFFPSLGPDDYVAELTCGKGSFLKAIPANVPAIGVEIDPALAATAAANSGREVLCGDFRSVVLPRQPSVIIGNPPWNVRDVTALLNRAHSLLPDETGTCGLILPAHRLSYSGPVLELAKLWSIQQTLLPKSLFPRLSLPVVFAHFRKERVRTMVGFFLFEEADAIKGMQASIKTLLATGKQRVGLWRAVVEESLHAIGRRAQLSQIYAYVEGRRPRPIPTWRDTIRRVLQEGPFVRFPDGTWALTGA